MFKGKTIKSVNKSACNVWYMHFTDGTSVTIEVEATSVPNLYGMKATKGIVK
jgi:hypothetical protein